MERIAVIGATGLIGHHTARSIWDAEKELVVIHRRKSALEPLASLEYSPAVADLDEPESLVKALQGVDAVINCAGYYPTTPRPWKAEVETATRQMDNFYRACTSVQMERIVYLGAAIALRRHPDGKPGDETLEYEEQPRDHNAYLQVKWAMDRQAREWARKGLPVVIGIPSMTFGEFDYGPTTGQLIVEIANQTLPAYVKGNRNVIYAGDAGRGLLACCENGRPGERYLLTGENTTMDDLVERIAKLAGVKPPRPVPLKSAKAMARVQNLRHRFLRGPEPKITPTAIAVMSAGQFLDGSKAEKELSFKALESLTDCLRRTLKWFRAVGYVRT